MSLLAGLRVTLHVRVIMYKGNHVQLVRGQRTTLLEFISPVVLNRHSTGTLAVWRSVNIN